MVCIKEGNERFELRIALHVTEKRAEHTVVCCRMILVLIREFLPPK
jgi:hypothetical protein